jgi:hypothetical protein
VIGCVCVKSHNSKLGGHSQRKNWLVRAQVTFYVAHTSGWCRYFYVAKEEGIENVDP